MSIIEIAFLGIDIGLVLWVIHLKMEIRKISKKMHPPVPVVPASGFTERDLHALRTSLAELVEDVEQYTELQLQKMRAQTQVLHSLCERMENKLHTVEEPAPEPPSEKNSARVVPLSAHPGFTHHSQKDKIIELYKKGWPCEKIAEALRITKSEVQLIVNLS
ncbi:MAG: hypothetical protein HPY51_00830 [Candidatus Omnitrophica bacterium]|nr:hypothetical protein [Candidatus Omnitrophota bacterium]HXK93107.1 hypothetical protein [bacterium]